MKHSDSQVVLVYRLCKSVTVTITPRHARSDDQNPAMNDSFISDGVASEYTK